MARLSGNSHNNLEFSVDEKLIFWVITKYMVDTHNGLGAGGPRTTAHGNKMAAALAGSFTPCDEKYTDSCYSNFVMNFIQITTIPPQKKPLPHLRLTGDHVVKLVEELGDDFVPLLLSVTFPSYAWFERACAQNGALVGVIDKIYHVNLGNIKSDVFLGSLYHRKQAVFERVATLLEYRDAKPPVTPCVESAFAVATATPPIASVLTLSGTVVAVPCSQNDLCFNQHEAEIAAKALGLSSRDIQQAASLEKQFRDIQQAASLEKQFPDIQQAASLEKQFIKPITRTDTAAESTMFPPTSDHGPFDFGSGGSSSDVSAASKTSETEIFSSKTTVDQETTQLLTDLGMDIRQVADQRKILESFKKETEKLDQNPRAWFTPLLANGQSTKTDKERKVSGEQRGREVLLLDQPCGDLINIYNGMGLRKLADAIVQRGKNSDVTTAPEVATAVKDAYPSQGGGEVIKFLKGISEDYRNADPKIFGYVSEYANLLQFFVQESLEVQRPSSPQAMKVVIPEFKMAEKPEYTKEIAAADDCGGFGGDGSGLQTCTARNQQSMHAQMNMLSRAAGPHSLAIIAADDRAKHTNGLNKNASLNEEEGVSHNEAAGLEPASVELGNDTPGGLFTRSLTGTVVLRKGYVYKIVGLDKRGDVGDLYLQRWGLRRVVECKLRGSSLHKIKCMYKGETIESSTYPYKPQVSDATKMSSLEIVRGVAVSYDAGGNATASLEGNDIETDVGTLLKSATGYEWSISKSSQERAKKKEQKQTANQTNQHPLGQQRGNPGKRQMDLFSTGFFGTATAPSKRRNQETRKPTSSLPYEPSEVIHLTQKGLEHKGSSATRLQLLDRKTAAECMNVIYMTTKGERKNYTVSDMKYDTKCGYIKSTSAGES